MRLEVFLYCTSYILHNDQLIFFYQYQFKVQIKCIKGAYHYIKVKKKQNIFKLLHIAGIYKTLDKIN